MNRQSHFLAPPLPLLKILGLLGRHVAEDDGTGTDIDGNSGTRPGVPAITVWIRAGAVRGKASPHPVSSCSACKVAGLKPPLLKLATRIRSGTIQNYRTWLSLARIFKGCGEAGKVRGGGRAAVPRCLC